MSSLRKPQRPMKTMEMEKTTKTPETTTNPSEQSAQTEETEQKEDEKDSSFLSEQEDVEHVSDVSNIIFNESKKIEQKLDQYTLLFSFQDIVTNLLVKTIPNEALDIEINDDIKHVIREMLSTNTILLNDIEADLTLIIQDNQINMNDISYIISMIQKIYRFICSLKPKDKKFTSEQRIFMTANILKYFIHILVAFNKIKINSEEKEAFLKNADNLIDSCVGMMSFYKNMKVKKCFAWK
jgi:hypothetical protein